MKAQVSIKTGKNTKAIADTLIAFEFEHTSVLENWDGDHSKLASSSDYLEKLFSDIDKDKN